MIKFEFESTGHPDYSRIVGAEMDKEYTAIEFIEEILKTHPRDYGRFTLGKMSYNYKNGVLDWALLFQEVMNKVVVGVKGMSSYFNTDYELILEDEAMSKGLNHSDIHELLDKLTKDEKQKILDLIAEDIADILANTRDKGYVVYKQPTTKSEEYLNKLRGA